MPESAASLPLTPAATVVVVRDGVDSLEVLMLKRSSAGAFRSHWVFPGGKVDAADHDPASDDPLSSFRRAAVREAAEEANLHVDLDELVTFAYWEPPASQPRRFATWFFLAAVQQAEVVVDGVEIDEHLWLAPAEVLARRDANEVELAAPTWMSLHALIHYETTAELLHAEQQRETPRFATHAAKLDGVPVTMWAGDVGYETSDPSLAGERHRLVMDPAGWRYEGSFPGRSQA